MAWFPIPLTHCHLVPLPITPLQPLGYECPVIKSCLQSSSPKFSAAFYSMNYALFPECSFSFPEPFFSSLSLLGPSHFFTLPPPLPFSSCHPPLSSQAPVFSLPHPYPSLNDVTCSYGFNKPWRLTPRQSACNSLPSSGPKHRSPLSLSKLALPPEFLSH